MNPDFNQRVYRSWTEKLREHFPNDQAPGFAFGFYSTDGLEWSCCGGMARLDQPSGITANTNFRLASITKQFTAAAILLLAQDGSVDLESGIRKYLSELPAWADGIIISNLLNHTSGIWDYEDLVPQGLDTALSDADVVRLLIGAPGVYFLPNSEFRYSNSGYALLANVIERVSGRSFPQFMEERIFDPLRMTGTLVYRAGKGMPQVNLRAYGYKRNDRGGYDFADQNMTSSVLGDGGIYCSLTDYGFWNTSLMQGTILPENMVSQMFVPGTLADGRQIPYGLGWRLEEVGMAAGGIGIDENIRPTKWAAYHPGGTTGFNHCVRQTLDGKHAIILLTNQSGAGAREITAELMALM